MSNGFCKDCVSGAIREGVATGREDTIHGLPCYVAEAPQGSPKGIIVIVPDAFGWKFINNRIIADMYAKKTNATVYLPEFMGGHGVNPVVIGYMDAMYLTGFVANLKKIFYGLLAARHFIPFVLSTRTTVVQPKIISFFTQLRESTPSLPIGVSGFCWGGRYAIKLTHLTPETPKPLVDAVFTAHPSNLSIPADIVAIQVPTSIAVGTKDIVMPMKQVEETKGLLTKKTDVPHEVVTYADARHGFAARADFNDDKQMKQANEAETQAVNWFSRFFGEWKST